jgi:putative transposase
MISYDPSLIGLDDTELMAAFKQTLGTDDQEASYRPLRDALQKLLERTMVAGFNRYVGAKRFKHGPQRRGQRNGFYHRGLLTQYGFISQLAVPRLRKGGVATRVFRRYQRRWKVVDTFIRKLFLAGVSTREVGDVMESLLDARVSAGTVSQVCQILDAEVRKFHHRKLVDDYRFLMLDGIVVKVTCAGKVGHRVMLVAYGIKHDRTRQVIAFRLGRSENKDACEAFLSDLYRRGLTGERLQLITIDGSKGLHAGVDLVYPHVPLQRCWVHKLSNIANKLKVRQRKACLAEARKIYQAPNRKVALAIFRTWARRWHNEAPKAVACLSEDLDELLAFYQLGLDQVMRPTVRTTNPIERLFRELRKRIRPMCTFANGNSCERIVYGLFQTYNQRWQDKKLWRPKRNKQYKAA